MLISGSGRSLRNLIERRAAGTLPVDIRLVISSSAKAGGLQFAAEAGIPAQTIARQSFDSDAAFGAANFDAIRAAGAKLVVLAGYLKLLPIPPDFENRVVNIHPALIPAFCGHGFYGHHVHEAVLDHGAKISGCTVHFVDNEFDHGPIILQRTVPVLNGDTPDTLADRVFGAELEALPDAIALIATGRVRFEGRKVVVDE